MPSYKKITNAFNIILTVIYTTGAFFLTFVEPYNTFTFIIGSTKISMIIIWGFFYMVTLFFFTGARLVFRDKGLEITKEQYDDLESIDTGKDFPDPDL